MRLTTLCALALLLFAVPARADSLRCGDRLVSVGETAGEVALKCGPPAFADRREDRIDTWIYNLGPQSFIRILTFVDGRLKCIETGGYGS